MRTLPTLVLCSLITIGSIALLTGSSHPGGDRAEAANLDAMKWIAGTWKGKAWGGTFEAYYSTAEGGRVLGHSRLFKGDRVVFYEFEMFTTTKDGKIRLHPFPGGKKATGLRAPGVVKGENKIVFENPDKDYPTRITYHRVSEDRLVITLDDPHGGSKKTETFDLKRVGS